jgi:hypothetical protein
MKIDLQKLLNDLNSIVAFADKVSVGAKSGCIVHLVKQDPQWPIIYFANDMNSVYGKYVHSGGIPDCDIAFRSHLFPDVRKPPFSVDLTREGVGFYWKKKGIDKSVIIPRENEIQSIVDKAFDRDFDMSNKVKVHADFLSAFENIGVSELIVNPQRLLVKQFKPTGEESYEITYDFKGSAKGWDAMVVDEDIEENAVTVNTGDVTSIGYLTGDEFHVSINGEDKPLCVSMTMENGTLQLMFSHMVYRL